MTVCIYRYIHNKTLYYVGYCQCNFNVTPWRLAGEAEEYFNTFLTSAQNGYESSVSRS